MLLNIILLLIFFLHSAQLGCGMRDVPFFDEVTLCSEGTAEREMSLYEFEKPPLPLERLLDAVFSPEGPVPLSSLRPFSGANELDALYMTAPRLKKISILESEESTKDEGTQWGARDKEEVKTIHLPPSFTPRLCRKRSQEVDGEINEDSREQSHDSLGRSAKKNKINLSAGSAFTPRLGRSEASPMIRFTPRLGRSSHLDRVIFNAKAAFDPRQQRSNRINLTAGSAFTPRLGRASDGSNKMIFNAGSTFTPRLGRSEDRNKIQLNAGSAFTPRLG